MWSKLKYCCPKNCSVGLCRSGHEKNFQPSHNFWRSCALHRLGSDSWKRSFGKLPSRILECYTHERAPSQRLWTWSYSLQQKRKWKNSIKRLEYGFFKVGDTKINLHKWINFGKNEYFRESLPNGSVQILERWNGTNWLC